ncbi:MAG: M48 family metallopeptidase [Fimbriimonadaceae bacterium]|nr:M48 family metallopeptidase [Fimbriimonadaceae bacterium]QYK56177.1 MAG: M48 family metallopeptidase [Fimbriimonadaceae bacterium]
MQRKRFPGLNADEYTADTDRKAMAALERLPLLPQVLGKFHELGWDRWMYCYNMAVSVRCGPTQYGTLYEIMRECCAILDVPEPELYISNNPFTNAFAGGVERPYITVRSSIVDALSDEQLFHLMGHELGHIKSGHLLFHSIAAVIFPLLEAIGRRTLGLGDTLGIGLALAFLEWSRQAELSADRAGLLCAQDFNLSASANLLLTAGPSRLNNEASVESFLDQSRAYQDMSALDSIGKAIVFFFYGSRMTHPMPVHRTKELEKWYLSGAYERLVEHGQVAGPV